MHKIIVLILILNLSMAATAGAQTQEMEQLTLDIEKLAQFKQILSDLKKGYQIVSTGYSTIKDLSQGNFNLHKVFLDGLMAVSPTVRKYRKIADIISDQVMIVKEYKDAVSRYKKDRNFNTSEIDYLVKIYSNLFKQGLKDLDDLTIIITDNKLRMSDEERLSAIDKIHDNMNNKLLFLRHFNNNTTILAVQRAKERNDAVTMKQIYGVNY